MPAPHHLTVLVDLETAHCVVNSGRHEGRVQGVVFLKVCGEGGLAWEGANGERARVT